MGPRTRPPRGVATAGAPGRRLTMKKLFRLISVCGIASLGIVATPLVASAAESTQGEGEIGTAASAVHGARKVFEHALLDVELRPDQQQAIEQLKAEAK